MSGVGGVVGCCIILHICVLKTRACLDHLHVLLDHWALGTYGAGPTSGTHQGVPITHPRGGAVGGFSQKRTPQEYDSQTMCGSSGCDP